MSILQDLSAFNKVDPNLQYRAISRKANDSNLRKWQKI